MGSWLLHLCLELWWVGAHTCCTLQMLFVEQVNKIVISCVVLSLYGTGGSVARVCGLWWQWELGMSPAACFP